MLSVGPPELCRRGSFLCDHQSDGVGLRPPLRRPNQATLSKRSISVFAALSITTRSGDLLPQLLNGPRHPGHLLVRIAERSLGLLLHLSHGPLGLFLHVMHYSLHLLLTLPRIHAFGTTPLPFLTTILSSLLLMLAEKLLDPFGRFVKPRRVQMLDRLHRVLFALRLTATFLPLMVARVLFCSTQPTLELRRLLVLSSLVKCFDLALRPLEFIAVSALDHFRVESAHLLHQLLRLVSPSLFLGGACPLFEFLDLAAERIAFFSENGRG